MSLLDHICFTVRITHHKKALQQDDKNQSVILKRYKPHAAQDDDKNKRKRFKDPDFCEKTTLLKKKMVEIDIDEWFRAKNNKKIILHYLRKNELERIR